jgi:predicted RNA binding protein YcfA (HicA-like mRNA interferase family)
VQEIKIVRIPGLTTTVEVSPLESLESIFLSLNISIDNEKECVYIGNGIVLPENFGKTHLIGKVIIIAKGVRGETPTPKVKDVIRYLSSLGYAKSEGKGDHIKFKKESSPTIIINRDNSDKKHICLGSARTLANILELNLSELFYNMSNNKFT